MVCPHFVSSLMGLLPFPCSAKAEMFVILTVVLVGISPLIYWVDGLSS